MYPIPSIFTMLNEMLINPSRGITEAELLSATVALGALLALIVYAWQQRKLGMRDPNADIEQFPQAKQPAADA